MAPNTTPNLDFQNIAMNNNDHRHHNMTNYAFASDNWAGADPAVLAAVVEANAGLAPPYGEDRLTRELQSAFSALFEREAFVFPVPTGTAANALALAAVTPGYGEIYCHADAHILRSEAGAVEFFTGGARLVPLPARFGRLDGNAFKEFLKSRLPRGVNAMQPATLSLTQPTETGVLYRPEQIAEFAGTAHDAGLSVHLDGARFANAIAGLGCRPADLSWRAGIDVLAFGAMKIGTLGADAVVAFDPAIAARLQVLHKRAGLLSSKQRFLAAQLIAITSNGLWLENARRTNALAARLGNAIAASGDRRLIVPVETNQVFCRFDANEVSRLRSAGLEPRRWPALGDDAYRLVISITHSDDDVGRFIDAMAG